MDCLPLPSMDYGAFTQSLWEENTGAWLPLCGSMEVTPYCNLKCRHCYITHCDWEEKVLSTKEVFRILDELAAAGCLWLLLTGGEPFLRRDFLDIYTHAKKKGFLLNLFSNATLVTDDIAKYIGEMKPFEMQITLYGASAETYHRVTGSAEAFQRSRQGIELLLQHGVPITLKAMVMSENVHELKEMQQYARGLGVHFYYDPVINPGLDGSPEVCQVRLTPQEIVRLDQEDPERRAQWKLLLEKFNPFGGEKPDPVEPVFTCGASRGRFHIDAFGHMNICFLVRRPSYDLRQGSFQDGYRGFLPNIVSGNRTKESACRTCAYRRLCVMCPGWSLLETGDIEEKPVPYLCQIAHLRAQAFGRQLKDQVRVKG